MHTTDHDPPRPASTPPGLARALRVVIQQPALTKYRVPVFRALASRPGIDLLLAFADDGHVPNVSAEDFRATFVPIKTWKGPGPALYWHAAQTRFADPSMADVLVLTWNTRFLSLLPALRRARRRGVATVLWGHGESKVERRWATALRRGVTRRATATLFYTQSMADRFIRDGGDPSRTFVAPNSIDQTPIAAARDRILRTHGALDLLRDQHHLTPGRTVLFVSRLEPANNLHLLLEAAASLRGALPGLRVLIVGKGTDEARLRALTTSRSLDGTVSFLGAIYDEEQLAPFFCASDVLCYPSNMGLSLLHAFGYALPVVTGDNARLHGPEIEALRHEHNGLTFAHNDLAALTATLRRILTDDQLRRRLGSQALQTVQTVYSIRSMVDGMESAIRFAASHAGKRGRRPVAAPPLSPAG